MEDTFLSDSRISSATTFVGAGPPRFYLPVDSEAMQSNYGQLIVNFNDFRQIDSFIEDYDKWAKYQFPQAMVRFRKYGVGPGDTWKFELRISGPANADLKVLRDLGDQILNILKASPYGTDWRTDMLNQTLKLTPVYDQKRARLSSISRENLGNTTRRSYDGLPVGLYREKDKLIPITVRSVDAERKDFINRFEILQVQPEYSTSTVPLSQGISDVKVEWENPIIPRSDRRRTISIQGAPKRGITFPTLQADVIKKIEAIQLPPGYSMKWDGEAKSSKEAQESLIPGLIPAGVLIVFLIMTVFNAYKPLLIIIITIPFAAIGITWSLLILQTPFGFMALLGALSLIGMMNKNIVVLLDAANENVSNGMDPYNAIIEAAVTRVRPVLLAAGTTVLGVIPLISDVFWVAMAVTIMGGLAFGSLLTLIVVPVLYSILYKIEEPQCETN